MPPPPARRKMKVTMPFSNSERRLYVEYILTSTSHSEARSSTKEQSPYLTNVSPSIEELAFRVMSLDHVLQASRTTITPSLSLEYMS